MVDEKRELTVMTAKSKPTDKAALTVKTEKSTDCNEFPDPGYGGADTDTYKFWPEASRISVNCYLESRINGINYTYLRTTSGCYVDEMSIQAQNIDFTARLPKCGPVRPYQVFTTKNEYLLPKDGFWMSCYKKPEKKSERVEVQWGARHILCQTEGQKINGDETWYRDAHNLKGKDEDHCYVPADAFDNMVYEIPGAGTPCAEFDRKQKQKGKQKLRQ